MLLTTITLYEAIDTITTKNYDILRQILKLKGEHLESYICLSQDGEFKLFIKLKCDGKFVHLSEQISKDKFCNLFMKKLEVVIYM